MNHRSQGQEIKLREGSIRTLETISGKSYMRVQYSGDKDTGDLPNCEESLLVDEDEHSIFEGETLTSS